MRIGILGASGRVGTKLVETILASPGLELGAALVSPGSHLIGKPVGGGSIEYRPAEKSMRHHCDVMIDFSSPEASLAFQEMVDRKCQAIVIGTTGFTKTQNDKLTAYSAYRPLLISANFAFGFEAFKQAALGFARNVPGAEPTIIETYHARKKQEPSGTSQILAKALQDERTKIMAFDAAETPIRIYREADVAGINEVKFQLASGEVSFKYTIQNLSAYVEGAIAAALWLGTKTPPNGRYSLADSLHS
ncbi:MAG: 4-hydroxy-tetrahydrodipicolinate reductase [Phyllobacterium sp.]